MGRHCTAVRVFNRGAKMNCEKLLKVKLKAMPQPYLHIAIVELAEKSEDAYEVGYAVFIWDTREVVASGKQIINRHAYYDLFAYPYMGKKPEDSHKTLHGGDSEVNRAIEEYWKANSK
jgi:hypothetical protein